MSDHISKNTEYFKKNVFVIAVLSYGILSQQLLKAKPFLEVYYETFAKSRSVAPLFSFVYL